MMSFLLRHRERYGKVLRKEISLAEAIAETDRDWLADRQHFGHGFCVECGSAVWPLRGTDVLTCRRGHHAPKPDLSEPLSDADVERLRRIWIEPIRPLPPVGDG